MFRILIAALVFVSTVGSALSDVKTETYKIRTLFSQKVGEKNIMMNSEVALNPANEEWTEILPEKEGVSVLGKLSKTETNNLLVQYMVIDTNRDAENAISLPTVETTPGKDAAIQVTGDGAYRLSVWTESN